MTEQSQEQVSATYVRAEGKNAVLSINDQEVSIPSSHLPAGIQAGQQLSLLIMTEQSAEKHREQQAKTVLNEILKGNSENESEET